MEYTDITSYEPKLAKRFLVKFPEEFEINPWAVKKIDKPYLIKEGHKMTWGQITIEFHDPIGVGVSKGLSNLAQRLLSDYLSGKIMFDILIESLDPTGVVVEQWTINVECVLEINFEQLDTSSDEMQKVSMIVLPSNCVLTF